MSPFSKRSVISVRRESRTLAGVDHLALLRNPGAEPAADRPRMKVGGGIFARCSFHGAANPNLTFELHPIKPQRGVWIRFELPAFFAVVIGEKSEAAFIEPFEQDDADGGFAVGRGRGQAHRIDVANVRGERGGEPGAELMERVGMKIGAAQPMGGVFIAQAGQIRRHRVHW